MVGGYHEVKAQTVWLLLSGSGILIDYVGDHKMPYLEAFAHPVVVTAAEIGN